MRKHRAKVVGAIVILMVLIVAWFQGERYNIDIDAANLNSVASVDACLIDEGMYPYIYEDVNNDDAVMPDESSVADGERVEDRQTIVTESTDHPSNDLVSTDTASPLVPVPDNEAASDGSFTVTLSVRVDTILDNMHLLSEEKHHLVPADGVIFPPTVVRVYEGESVFNVLQREMRRAGIHMAFRNTPVFDSAYVMGINNLYEFDVGRLSGWMYRVNGWFPNFGSSRYILSPGDVIEWVYTVDLGRDVGEYWLAGGQRDE